MEKIVFVILHYKVLEVTDKCIDLLLKQEYNNLNIIVLDNCSNNGSLEILKNKYEPNNKIEFISVERNYGFAKTNDIGYLIAKHKYNADYIIIVNNDIMIHDTKFCEKLLNISRNSNYGIIGPDIINLKGEHQNPYKNVIRTKKELYKTIFFTRLRILFIPIFYDWFYKNNNVINSGDITERKENFPLHGSCVAFCKDFIKNNEFAFYPDTFLYCEEDILFYFAKKDKVKMLYEPTLKVQHMEKMATKSIVPKQKSRRLFQLKQSLKSLKIFKEIMKEN